MRSFIEAVRSSVAAGHWHAALALALTLPEVCAAAESPGRGKSEARYKAWWTEWAQPYFTAGIGASRTPHVFLSAGDAYALRCSYLHSGSDVIDGQKASEVLKRFVLTYGGSAHLNQSDGLLQMDVALFSLDVAKAVEAWCEARGEDQMVSEVLKGLVSLKDGRSALNF